MRSAIVGLMLIGCSAARVVPASAPRSGGLDVDPVSGLGLFADERARSRTILVSGLSIDAGLIDPEVTGRAWGLAAEGKNPLTGAACGRPLGVWQARQRWASALGITGSVASNVWCESDGGCELEVVGRTMDDLADDRFHLVAPFSAAGNALTSLTSAVARLAPPAPNPGPMADLLGSMGGSAPIQEVDRLEVSVWNADRRARTVLTDAQGHQSFPTLTAARVLTCLSANDSRVELLIDVSATGTISRCEGQASEEAEAARCGCGQLQRAQLAPWLAGQRWTVDLSVDRRDQTTSDRRLVLTGSWNTYLQEVHRPGDREPHRKPKVEDPSIEAWSTGPSQLAVGCFADALTAAGYLNSRWAVWFDAQGRPTKVLEQKGYPPLRKDLAACVSRALQTAQAPCPSRAGLWAMADLSVSARDPNAPETSLKEVLTSP